jgi:hypothetical protein
MQILLLTSICMSFLGPVAWGQTISAGLWKARTEVTVNSLPLPAIPVEDCISQKEAKDIRHYLEENLMPETSCKITKWDFKAPDLKASLNCDGKQGTSKGSLSGKVTEKSFDIAGTMTGQHVVLGTVELAIKYNGHYVKACK